jgi:histidinol-phosphatase (PHP family)
MIDAHIHLERGPYSAEWVDRFVENAVIAGIDEIHLLEHTFQFREFRAIYDHLGKHPEAGVYQQKWLDSKFPLSLSEYQQLASAMRIRRYPIKVKFGLEVCYFPESEKTIRELVSDFEWDFLTGSIHWIDGFGFDLQGSIPIWEKSNVNGLYLRYYDLMGMAIESGLFNVIAHPDSIKVFHFYPPEDMGSIYMDIASLARKNGVKLEFSGGLALNYGHKELGMNRALLSAVKQKGVDVATASDAHRPEDVGKNIREAERILLGTHPLADDKIIL